MSRGVRAQYDSAIMDYMKDELTAILENDQICFRESEDAENDYKLGLARTQKEHTQRIFDTLEKEFNIKLKIFHTIQMEPQDPSVSNL